MRFLWLFTLLFLTSFSSLFGSNEGGGSRVGGGGDANESNVNEIRLEILNWIMHGGSRWIQFPEALDQDQYDERMIKILAPKAVIVNFTSENIFVSGMPKTCQGFMILGQSYIQCHIDRFSQITHLEQFRLIHHEYAGLAGIEQNEGAASDYEISNQLKTRDFKVCGFEGSINQRVEDCRIKGSLEIHQIQNEKFGWSKVSEYQDGLRIYWHSGAQRLWAFYVTKQSTPLIKAKLACSQLGFRSGLFNFANWHLPDEIELFSAITWGFGEINEDVRSNSFIWIDNQLNGPYPLLGFKVASQSPVNGYFEEILSESVQGVAVCTASL